MGVEASHPGIPLQPTGQNPLCIVSPNGQWLVIEDKLIPISTVAWIKRLSCGSIYVRTIVGIYWETSPLTDEQFNRIKEALCGKQEPEQSENDTNQ